MYVLLSQLCLHLYVEGLGIRAGIYVSKSCLQICLIVCAHTYASTYSHAYTHNSERDRERQRNRDREGGREQKSINIERLKYT